jgi:hypothetical protein
MSTCGEWTCDRITMTNSPKLFVTKTNLARLMRIDSRSVGLRNKIPDAVLLNGSMRLPIFEISDDFLGYTTHGTQLAEEIQNEK